jgi:hypothetical protein
MPAELAGIFMSIKNGTTGTTTNANKKLQDISKINQR